MERIKSCSMCMRAAVGSFSSFLYRRRAQHLGISVLVAFTLIYFFDFEEERRNLPHQESKPVKDIIH